MQSKSKCCERCGVYYTPTGRAQKYCPDCRLAIRAEQSGTYYRKQRASSQAVREVVARDESLRLISRVADWAGVTYGKLVSAGPDVVEDMTRQYLAAMRRKQNSPTR